MADTKDFVFPVAGKKIPGYTISNSSDGSSSWFAGKPSDALYGAQATFRSYKLPDGKWTWREAAPGAINSLAQTNKVTAKQINDVLYDKNSTVPSALNEQRVSQLGKEAATKLGVPGTNNVASGSKKPDTPTPQAASEEAINSTIAQVQIGDYRKNYGNLIYPLNMQKTQDCIKFIMYRYVPKKFNPNSALSSGDSSSDLFTDSKEEKVPLGSVILPIQSPISDTNAVSWGQDNMNAVEANVAGLALNLITGGSYGKSPEKIGETVTNSVSELKALVGITLAGKAATGTSGSLFTRLTGGIINPNMELLFNGPELRGFSFNFTMSAREPDEAKQIKSIIRFFKQGMSVKRAKSSLFLITPNVFEISYLYRGNNSEIIHPWMNRIKTCALQNCSINYTPAGNYATYQDGSMTSYEMTLSFGELTPIYDDDYKFEGNINAPIAHIGY
jgi:hypothetical protein